MMKKDAIAKYLPHAGNMCLVDEVIAWQDQKIHCRTLSHLDDMHPLKKTGILHASQGIEYAAQAAALHLALQASATNHIHLKIAGRLAAIQECTFHVARLDNILEPINIHCSSLFVDNGAGAFYEFMLSIDNHPQKMLITGRFLIMFTIMDAA